MRMLKLFKVTGYNVDGRDLVVLKAAATGNEAEQIVQEEYKDHWMIFYGYDAEEIDNVDGYKITLNKL